MARWAIVRTADKQVNNVVEWDGTDRWTPPLWATMVEDINHQAEPGGTWVSGNTFTKAPDQPPPPDDVPLVMMKRLLNLLVSKSVLTNAERFFIINGA